MPDTVTDAFECFEPNEATLAAMAEAAQGELVTTGSVAEFMAELKEDLHGADAAPP
ncbi:MAG: hypothetical protein OXF79_14775 [Chloroflexi bacterium]|nr:hypothetical protein [Chloroflexota bacterium]